MKIKLITMRKIGITLLLLFTIFKNTSAQKAHEVLEDGIPVEKNENIFLKVTEDNLKYYIGEKPTRPVSLTDSIIFLIKNSSINVYLKPLNPLNYSYSSENTILKNQPIDQEESNSYKVVVSPLSPKSARETNNEAITFQSLIDKSNMIKKALSSDNKESINKLFTVLKKMSFTSESETKKTLEESKEAIDILEKYYKDLEESILNYKESIEKYVEADATKTPQDLVKIILLTEANSYLNIKNNQYKRLSNLLKAYDLVKNAQVAASENEGDIQWCFYLAEVPAPKGKLSAFTVTINKSGLRLSTEDDKEVEKDEIISENFSRIFIKTLRIRRFQRFIPEVSSGIAYTNLNFPKFGTSTDSISGKTFVTDAGNDIIKKVNITTMLNYNYYIQNSPIHPFIQVGVGANVDFPTLLLGGGLRFNANGNKRFALTIGGAASWIKSLDKLSIGAQVEDEGELQKDITYQFAYPKLYYGIQYNF